MGLRGSGQYAINLFTITPTKNPLVNPNLFPPFFIDVIL